MASETILVRLRAIGTRRFRRDMDDASDSVDDLGESQDRASAASGRHRRSTMKLTSALRLLAVVTGIAAGAQGIGLLVSALGPALVAVLALTAGVIGLAGALGVMGLAAVQHFKATQDIAGSVANRLKEQAGLLKSAFAESTARGATAVLAGLIPILRGVRGVVRDLKPDFTALGQSMGGAMRWFGESIRTMSPDLSALLHSTQGAWQPLAEILSRLIRLVVRLGKDAMPYIIDGLTWMSAKLLDWNQAVANGAGVDAFQLLGDIFDRIGDVLAVILPFIGVLLAGLGQIADGSLPGLTDGVMSLTEAFRAVVDSGVLQTLGAAVGDTFAFIAGVIATVTTELQRVGLLKPVILGVAAAFVVWKVATLALNLAMYANPVVLVIAAIAALAVGVIYAYRRFEWFRNIVDGAWGIIKSVASWIASNWRLVIIGLTGPLGAAVVLIVDNFGKIKSAVSSTIDVLGGIVTFVAGLPARIKAAATGLWDGLKSGLDVVIKWAADQIDGLIDKFNKINPFGDVGKIDYQPASDGAGPMAPLPGLGTVPLPRALGGPIPGGPPYLDRVPVLATPGEHMWTRGEVQAAGGHRAVEEMRRGVRRPAPAAAAPAAAPTATTVRVMAPIVITKQALADMMAEIHLDVQAGIPV